MMFQIDMNKIEQEIDDMPIISETRKQFYKVLLKGRYETILKASYQKLKE